MNALTKSNGSPTGTKEVSTVDRLMNNFFNDFESSWNNMMTTNTFGYTKNLISEEDGVYTWAFNATAMKKDWINIELSGRSLLIEGETPEDNPIANRMRYKYRLPKSVDTDTLDAKLEGGILYITAEQKEREISDSKRIEIE